MFEPSEKDPIIDKKNKPIVENIKNFNTSDEYLPTGSYPRFSQKQHNKNYKWIKLLDKIEKEQLLELMHKEEDLIRRERIKFKRSTPKLISKTYHLKEFSVASGTLTNNNFTFTLKDGRR